MTIAGADATGVDSGFSFSAIVNTRGDTTDDDGGATGRLHQGSLRQFILNSNAIAGAQTSNFSIGTGAVTIAPAAALPTITDAVILDATTQEGFGGAPLIELNGAGAGAGADGLGITAGNSTVRGFIINRFTDEGIEISGGGNNLIVGNYIGTDITGAIDLGNSGNGLDVTSPNNTIGGTGAAGNLISGNNQSGMWIHNATAIGNVVRGNTIGTNLAGSAAVANTFDGVLIADNASGTTVGGTAAGEGNLISGNTNGRCEDPKQRRIEFGARQSHRRERGRHGLPAPRGERGRHPDRLGHNTIGGIARAKGT